MAVPTLMFSILSQIMPPMTRLFSLLVELPGFLEAFGPFVFPDRHHTQYLSFFDCYFYFITKSLIMPLERLPQIRQIQEE